MMADVRLSYAKTLGVRGPEASSRIRRRPLLVIVLLLLELLGTTVLRHSIAETTAPSRPFPSEDVPGFPKHGSVTTVANLRSAPSIQSEVVSVINDGTPVEILTETGRWYRVKTAGGIEAWIGKSLVTVEPTPRQMPSAVSGTAVQPEMQMLEGSSSPAHVTADASAGLTIAHSQATAGQSEAGASLGLPEEVAPIFLEEAEFKWTIERMFPYMRRLEPYIIPTLGAVLILAISFQLKAARQLRRAMQEMGLILDIVDDIYVKGILARTGDGETMATPLSNRISLPQLETPSIQFSALEHAVLQAMSDHREVDEKELTETLAAQGFAGVLIKAVIGGIIRKTKASGRQCVEVRYVQGRYRYQLRREGRSAPYRSR